MKKMISILTVLVLSVVTMLPVKVMAAEYPHKNSEVKHVNLLSDKTEYGIQPQTDGYYYWKVDSKTNQGTTYGSWRLGPQGAGPGTVSVNKTDTVTNTISGSYTSVGDISASLGATIGKSQSILYSTVCLSLAEKLIRLSIDRCIQSTKLCRGSITK